MKLPTLFTRDTAGSLRRAISERDEAERKLAELHTKRAAALLDTDEIDAVQAIDREIEAAHRTASILADRIIGLDSRLREEEAAAREKAYAADIAAVERLLPVRNEAADQVEKAMLALAAACRKYSEITGSIVSQFPASVAKPSYQTYHFAPAASGSATPSDTRASSFAARWRRLHRPT